LQKKQKKKRAVSAFHIRYSISFDDNTKGQRNSMLLIHLVYTHIFMCLRELRVVNEKKKKLEIMKFCIDRYLFLLPLQLPSGMDWDQKALVTFHAKKKTKNSFKRPLFRHFVQSAPDCHVAVKVICCYVKK
jgi:hypothetical protein